MGLTTDQLEARRAYLGGTDMAALAGVNPPAWTQPLGVWLDKTGQAPAKETNRMMSAGSLLEPVVAALFAEATGMRLRKAGAPVRDRRRPWLGGNVDRYASPDTTTPAGSHHDLDGPWQPGVLECKWGMDSDKWGPSAGGTAGMPPAKVPPHYRVQLQHYLGITGRPVGYMAVLLGYADFRWYVLPRDEATIDMLRELGTRFWHDNVLAGVPPEPDGSEAYTKWLAGRHTDVDGLEAVATDTQAAWWRDWLAHDLAAKAAAAERDKVRQQLQTSMAKVSKLLLPDGSHILYRSHPKRAVQWEAVATAMAGNDQRLRRRLARLQRDQVTITTERPWRPKPVGSDKED